jgi:hypothetical protein
VRFFQEQGFRVLPSPWKNPDAGVAFIRCARKDATARMLGVLFRWSAGGNGERLMAALKGETDTNDKDTAKQVAATIKAGLKELGESVVGPKQDSPR